MSTTQVSQRLASPQLILTRGRPDPRARLLRLVVVALGLVIFVIGWRVVGIDLPKLVAGLPAAQHILVGLVTPDMVTHEVTTTELSAPFVVGRSGDQPSVSRAEHGETLTISPGAVQGTETVPFAGAGFPPNSEGTLTLEYSAARGTKISDIQTDATGQFELTFPWKPSIEAGDYTVQLVMRTPTGRILPSETLILALQRIWETVLLALMGTVFGVLISVPLSFLGARNIMHGTLLGQTIYVIVRTIFNLGRAIEVLILAVIMAVGVGIVSFSGI